MRCAETFVMRLPDNYHQAARDALAHRPRSACGPRRSLAVVPLIGDKRYYGETPMRLRRDCRPIGGNGPGGWRWVRGQRLTPTWAGAINRGSGNRQRSNAEAQLGHGFYRSATFPQGLTAVLGTGDGGKASAGVACGSHTEPSADAGIDSFRVEGWPGAQRTTVTQHLICAPLPAEDKLGLYTWSPLLWCRA
jgi:hypothetical protein